MSREAANQWLLASFITCTSFVLWSLLLFREVIMTHEIPRIPSSMPEKPQEAPTVPVPAVRKSRRGRRSTVPPEQREHVRRLKKQNMERRRRACIADKMNALHSLAMNLIGEDPAQYQKAEKADLLNMCYNVFEHLVTIVNDEPDIRRHVHRIMEQKKDQVTNQITIPSSTCSPAHSFTRYECSATQTTADKENWSRSQNLNSRPTFQTTFQPSPSFHQHQIQQQGHTPVERIPYVQIEKYWSETNHPQSPSCHSTGNSIPSTSQSSSSRSRISVDSGIDQVDQSIHSYSVWNLTNEFTKHEVPEHRFIRNPFSEIRGTHLELENSPVVQISTKQLVSPSTGRKLRSAQSTPLWRPYLE